MASVSEIPVNAFANANSKTEIRVIFAGKNGSGKSTLINNVFRVRRKATHSPRPVTEKTVAYCKMWNGVLFKAMDMVCQSSTDKVELPKLRNRTDLLIYCLPVGPGSKFSDGNPVIMKSIQQAYGNGVWKHCILVFTFSDLLLLNLCDTSAYNKYLQECAHLFEEELVKLGNQISVTPVFRDLFRPVACSVIVAIPVGRRNYDTIFPVVTSRNKNNEQQGWIDTLFDEMGKSCKDQCKTAFKQYREKEEAEIPIPPITEIMVAGCAVAGGLICGAVAVDGRLELRAACLTVICGMAVGGLVSSFCLRKNGLASTRDILMERYY